VVLPRKLKGCDLVSWTLTLNNVVSAM